MKHLLYAMDYTNHSLVGLQYAYDLSSRIRAKLTILHVYDTPTFSGTTMIGSLRQTQKRAFQEQRSVLEAYCAKHLGEIPEKENIEFEVLKHISVIDGVLETIKRLSVDMVIIGIKDVGSKRGFLEGDIAKTLITKALCTVLVIPNNSDAKQIKNIVYATDFEEDDIPAIVELASLASFFEATINVIHISDGEKNDDENQMEWFKEMVIGNASYPNIEFDILIASNVQEELLGFLNSIDADLIALLEREERGLLKKLFHKDLVKQIEEHTPIPLMSFNSKQY